MLLAKLYLSFAIISSAYALPTSVGSAYAVKERHAVLLTWSNDGPASRTENVHLQIGLRQRNEGLVETHLVEISDPKHVRYGQYLTASEIRELVAPSQETTEQVRTWLADHGIPDPYFHPGNDWISIVISVEKAEQLLQTSYSRFRHEDGTTITRAPEWSLPLHLYEHIDVVEPTTSFFRPQAAKVHAVADAYTETLAEFDAKYGAMLEVNT